MGCDQYATCDKDPEFMTEKQLIDYICCGSAIEKDLREMCQHMNREQLIELAIDLTNIVEEDF